MLKLYEKLSGGFPINKSEEAALFGVNERTIQRDIEDIREYVENSADDGGYNRLVYDRAVNAYRLERTSARLSNGEILAMCKILLDSRAFPKEQMQRLLGNIADRCAENDSRKLISELIRNEMFHYIEPRHKTDVSDTIIKIGCAIREQRYIEIEYFRLKDKAVITRKVKPAAVMFSEYYFYMTAFIDEKENARKNFDVPDDVFPTIYRIDRIKRLTVLDERFEVIYSKRFEEGEFRKRVQFMYGGRLRRIKFEYSGVDIDAILDRLPTAKVLSENNGVYTVSAEVFGNGIDMWIRSQGDNIKLL